VPALGVRGGTPEGTKLRFILERHDEERRSSIEPVAFVREAAAATPRLAVLLHDRDVQAAPCQVRGGCDATDAGTDNEG
jgi:hypothetical protein